MGGNAGPRPLETLLIGLGACSAFDVVTILRKARQTVSDCRVELEAERADAVPAVFTRIHMVFVVSGTGLRESAVRRVVDLSAEKYCSATDGDHLANFAHNGNVWNVPRKRGKRMNGATQASPSFQEHGEERRTRRAVPGGIDPSSGGHHIGPPDASGRGRAGRDTWNRRTKG